MHLVASTEPYYNCVSTDRRRSILHVVQEVIEKANGVEVVLALVQPLPTRFEISDGGCLSAREIWFLANCFACPFLDHPSEC